tara:strand:- start:1050 stop:2045 length:996 start_codon:yes stop_codon:yes gene_type:complete
MKTIGVVIGTTDEPITEEYYSKRANTLSHLEEYDIYSDYIPYDYAIYSEIKRVGEKNGFEVIPLFGDEFTLIDANKCDYIFSVFEGVYSFMVGGLGRYNQYMNILKKTKAKVYPSQKMQEFIIKKHKYMKYLDTKGYNITPTSFINLKKYNVKTIMKFIEKNKLNQIIIKPELGAFKTGFKIINNPNEKKISEYLSKLKKEDYTNVLLQSFIEEFNKFGEIKTYWSGGKFIYAYRQRWLDGEGVFSQVEDKQLLRECKIIGKKLLEDISKDHENLIQCRIDFACCANNDKRCREFFINEIEISPTIGSEHYELYGKAYTLLANNLIKEISS